LVQPEKAVFQAVVDLDAADNDESCLTEFRDSSTVLQRDPRQFRRRHFTAASCNQQFEDSLALVLALRPEITLADTAWNS
jgi:hypothetical protein